MTRSVLNATLPLLFVAGSLCAQTCEVTGSVPPALRGPICGIAASVHGGGEPVNQLTVMVKQEIAYGIAAKTPDAKNLLLQLLGAWKRTKGVRVAQVEVFYGKAHLATVETTVFSGDKVEFH